MSDLRPHRYHTREDAPPDGSDVEMPGEEARQGETSGRMRIVLFVSLAVVSAIFLTLWLVIARL